MKYAFHILDVFSSTPFGGSNPDFDGMAYRLSIQQGVSMGRRSDIEAEARKRDDVVIDVPPFALVS